MVCIWLILAVSLGQATQPAGPSPTLRVPPVIRSPQIIATQPASGIPVLGPTASRPALPRDVRGLPGMSISVATRPAVANGGRRPTGNDGRPSAANGAAAPRMSVAIPGGSATRSATQPAIVPAVPPSVTAAPGPIVGQPPLNQPLVREIIAPPAGGTATQPTTTTEANALAQIAKLSGLAVDIQLTTDGKLILTGSPADLEILQNIIAQLDRQLVPPFEVRIFKMEGAQASTLASQLEVFWSKAKAPPGGQLPPEDKITIFPETRSNSLIVAASSANMPQIAEIIDKLNQPKVQFDIYPVQLKSIKANEAEKMITDLLNARATQTGQPAGTYSIKADLRTNSLLISAPEAEVAQIKKLIDVIDVEPRTEGGPGAVGGGSIRLAIFPLEKSNAGDLATILDDMLKVDTKSAQEQIRRLQLVLKSRKGPERELPALNLEKPIRVLADKSSNSLIVATTEANMAPIGEIIKVLDTVPLADEMLVRIYPLEYADADTIRQTLEEMFTKGAKLPVQPGREDIKGRIPPTLPGSALAYPVAISADKRSNTLVVSGRPEQLMVVEQVVKAVDVPESANRYTPKLVQLEHADAKRIADAITKIIDQRQAQAEKIEGAAANRDRSMVVADPRSNSLIVVANEENFQEIQRLARQLDGVSPEYLGQIRIINLKNLTAADLATKVKDLWAGRAKIRREGELPEDTPVIATDARSNSLIIASNREDFDLISRLVQELEQQKLSPMTDIRPLIIKHNDPTRIADMLRKLWDERLKINTAKGEDAPASERIAIIEDPLSKTLLIASSQSNYEEIVRLVTQLDVPPPVEGLIRTFYVRNTDVARAAEMLQTMFDKGIYQGAVDKKNLPESSTKVTIVPDVRSSALIVSASPENMAVIQNILTEIDRAETPNFAAEVRVFKVQNADAGRIADTLDQMFKGMQAAAGTQKEVLTATVVPDLRNNTVMVTGSRLAVRRAEEVIPMLDVAPGQPTAEVRVYPLQQASATRLAATMTDLFAKRGTEQKGKTTTVTVLADETSNSLVVTASREDQAIVQDLVGKLDIRSTLAQQMEVIPLRQARSDAVADTLTKLLQQQAAQGKGGTGFAITADPRTNSLLVFAPPDLMGNIRSIVQRLDTTRPAEEMALRVFELKNARAEDLSKLLDDFFKLAAGGATGSKEARQLIINFAPVNAETGQPVINPETGAEVIQRLVHQDITITPDKNTNSLVVMAPEGSIDMMRMLIEMLDSVRPVTAEIQVFPLLNADASEMRKLLEELFTPKGGGAAGAERRTLSLAGEGAAGAAAAPAAGATGGAGGTAAELAFSVDTRTNSLIAAGSPTYLKTVERLVTQLDTKEQDERTVRVVHLRNAKAADVATAMRDYFKEESSAVEKASKDEAATRALERQVTIQDAGKTSNTLLLSYSPRMESQIISMINELDQPPPQVMIQLLMAEVTLSDNFEMGMEFALQDLAFTENAVVTPHNTLEGHSFDKIFGTDLGAAGTGGGLSFTVTGEDFNFLFRALQTEGRLEVLSRPSIMVRDNEKANITVGERVPTVQDIVVSSAGVVTPSVTYEEIGIILGVTPIINPDGFVNLDITPEISAIGTSTVTVASGVTLPTFTTRKAETAVTVKDGETIIIGGLITSRETTNDNKVPLIGDIPIVGLGFRSTKKTTDKTELLIVLTPHVIRDPSQAHTISVQMRDQTGLNDNVRQNQLMQGLQVTPEEGMLGPCTTQPVGEQEQGPELEEFGPSVGSTPPAAAVPAKSETVTVQGTAPLTVKP
jgi:type II secretion system protein D